MNQIINFFKNLYETLQEKFYDKIFKRLLKKGYIQEVVSKSLTAKEAKLISEYFLKQSEKYSRMASSLFSQEEKVRANSCKEGFATTELHNMAIDWLNTHNWNKDIKYKDIFIKDRPNTKNIIGETKSEFHSTKLNKYYNIYFASWYYKRNWENIVMEWLAV